jgi:predicted naringenin-chalcone synthase
VELSLEPVHLTAISAYLPELYTQDEVIDQVIRRDHRRLARRLASSGRIATRGVNEMPSGERLLSRDQLAAYHDQHAPHMAYKALSGLDIDLADLDAVIAVNSTGFSFPGIAETLRSRFGVGRLDAVRLDLVGQGCVGAMTALQTARAMLLSRSSELVAVACSEPNVALWSPAEADRRTVMQQMLFGEGAAAVCLGRQQESSRLPAILDFATSMLEGTENDVSISQGEQTRASISKAVPELVSRGVRQVAGLLLQRHGLTVADIRHWAFHTGGRKILEAFQEALGLSDQQMQASWRTLERYGNVQSASVLLSLAELIETTTPAANDLGALVAVGPGITLSVALLRWM